VTPRALAAVLALLPPFASAEIPLGPEFQVNTNTAASLSYSSVASDAAGKFVVTWDNVGSASYFSDVSARVYDATGSPVGNPFVVNATTAFAQALARAAWQGTAGFVVVWSNATVPSNADIFMRRFDASGAPLTSEITVNASTAGIQNLASVSADAAGNFVVVWESRTGDDVFGQRFNALGGPVGPEFRVNSTTTNTQSFPSVAMAAGGSFVVVWQSFDQDGSDRGVFGQRYDAGGAAVGGEFQVNTYATGAQEYPQVASDAAGNLFVSWTSDGQDGSGSGVFGRRFDSAGTASVPISGSATRRPTTSGTPRSRRTTSATSSWCGRATARTATRTVLSGAGSTPAAR
jgi:hypothetical protein